MIYFGPAGNSESFYAQGFKHTVEQMAWLKNMGLNAYEYSFGRGVRLKEGTAREIGEEARKNGIALSVHAPYFINLASDDPEKYEKNLNYFTESARAATWLGATRVIFHPGSCAKLDRAQAVAWTAANLEKILKELEGRFDHLLFCPETMGKLNQVGDLAEVLAFCKISDQLLPTIDFGHLHARGIGSINSREDFAAILDTMENELGRERMRHFHVHFSKIEFTGKGEKAHRIFADEGFGPDFAFLAPELVARELEPTIICESKGTMAEDARTMKELYEKELGK